MVLRTRLFVGIANLLPDFDLISTFIRPLLLRMAGARIGLPSRIRRPLFIHYAGNLSVGRYAFINQGFRVEGLAEVSIGESVLVGPFCCFENVNHRADGPEALPVAVGKGAWIGAGSIILPGAWVGEGAVVAAGSVVRGRVPPHEVWGGVPARFIRKLGEARVAPEELAVFDR
ncbi:MAG TPA: acyltransferase [Blastocatellia bacterium]|nr:acyltransferase [Blastocatellia bacterium]